MSKKKRNPQWDRVRATNISAEMTAKTERNKNRLKDPGFIKTCEKAGIQPTARQASKYKLGKGLAYQKRRSV